MHVLANNSRAAKISQSVMLIVPFTVYYNWKYARYDVVFDIYHQDSLKSETRQKRGTGVGQ